MALYIKLQFVLYRELESVTIGKASLLVLCVVGAGVYCGNYRNINTLNGENTQQVVHAFTSAL
jgi:hypothetical protein